MGRRHAAILFFVVLCAGAAVISRCVYVGSLKTAGFVSSGAHVYSLVQSGDGTHLSLYRSGVLMMNYELPSKPVDIAILPERRRMFFVSDDGVLWTGGFDSNTLTNVSWKYHVRSIEAVDEVGILYLTTYEENPDGTYSHNRYYECKIEPNGTLSTPVTLEAPGKEIRDLTASYEHDTMLVVCSTMRCRFHSIASHAIVDVYDLPAVEYRAGIVLGRDRCVLITWDNDLVHVARTVDNQFPWSIQKVAFLPVEERVCSWAISQSGIVAALTLDGNVYLGSIALGATPKRVAKGISDDDLLMFYDEALYAVGLGIEKIETTR